MINKFLNISIKPYIHIDFVSIGPDQLELFTENKVGQNRREINKGWYLNWCGTNRIINR